MQVIFLDISMTVYYTITLISAVVYSLSALFLKRSAAEGAGLIRTIFVMNWLRLLAVLPLLLINYEVVDWSMWVWPLAASIAYFLAISLVLIGIKTGEVSVQTPILGTKVLFATVFAMMVIGVHVSKSLWIGASLSFLAIFILGIPTMMKSRVSFVAVLYALGGSMFLGLTDVLIAKGAPLFGEFPFLVAMAVFLCLESFLLMPFFKKGLVKTPQKAWKWLLIGCLLMAIEEAAMFAVLGFSGKVTSINVVYSSRGIWSILLVVFIGHWFGNEEKRVGKRTMISRMTAAIILTAAIFIILNQG